MKGQIEEIAKYWASSSIFDNTTRNEIAKLLETNNLKELTERFYKDLEFGTGGLRGLIGAGTSRINVFNIRKASAAFASYLRTFFDDETELKIAITYDSRQFSKEFTTTATEVFTHFNIKCYVSTKPLPVPMLSYMVRHFGCHGGICITASHNPPQYNGYKVYWQTGGQIVPPHDKEIIKRYKDIASYEEIKTKPIIEAKKEGLVVDVDREFEESYFEKVKALSLSNEGKEDFIVAYSPLHGTGAYPVNESLKSFGFKNIHIVEEQKKPDGKFPTISSPNPEDPKALKMVLELAEEKKADIALATDPDTDRIGIAVLDDDQYKLLNGNQIVCLMTEYILSQKKARKELPKNAVVIKTIVTTDLLREICNHYDTECLETLTGFKWIADWIERFEIESNPPSKSFICGGEESYGFLYDTFIRDKDGVMACSLAAEMTAYYKSKNQTLFDVLDSIYIRHGIFRESLETFSLPGREGTIKIESILQSLRTKPPSKINGKEVKVIRDLQTRSEQKIIKGNMSPPTSIDLPKSNVIQFILEDESKISIRPSGTEPKVKFYFSIKEPLLQGFQREEFEVVKIRSERRLAALSDNFISMIKTI